MTAWIESTIGVPDRDAANWVTVPFRFGDREYRVARPREPDRLLDDPSVLRASREHDYMPYWAYLWPGAVLLAERLAAEPAASWRNRHALEIGCGLGLAGLVALERGCHLTFSDYSPAALELAAHNARLNRFDQFATMVVDWKAPPAGSFELILGADVLYESRCLAEVLRVLDRMLAPGGRAWLADPHRSVADPFADVAGARGYSVACSAIATSALGGRAVHGRIFELFANRASDS